MHGTTSNNWTWTFSSETASEATTPAEEVVASWSPQEVIETASGIQVAPVTGMTPAAVATELRTLIRDRLWVKIRALGNAKPPVAHLNLVDVHIANAQMFQDRARSYDLQMSDMLIELREVIKRRRPREGKEWIRRFRELKAERDSAMISLLSEEGWIRSEARRANQALDHVAPAVSPELMKEAERAYALVQALPTIDNPSLGRAENALRAITAMIKVYHGAEVETTVAQLPDIMPDLLASIRNGNHEAARTDAVLEQEV